MVSDLGLQCLPMSLLWDARHKWVRMWICAVQYIQNCSIQSTPVVSKSKGLSKIFRDIRTSTYQILKIEEKEFKQLHLTNLYVIGLLKLRDISKILWKRGEIAPEEQFLLFSTIFFLLVGRFSCLGRDKIFTSR